MKNTREQVAARYKNDKGEPFILTDGQVGIFEAISKKRYPRNHVETHTRYGKSETISMAVLIRVATYPEKWAIVAGTREKAGIIIGYIIKHIFDNSYTHRKFILEPGESEESIRRYKNKSRINFDLGNGLIGEVFITTAANAMGLGAPNVVEDESALITGKDHALVMRMLGDQTENFLVKVGNPWESDHFRASREDPAYHKIRIDYLQGIKEGRLTPEYAEEMRKQPFFDVLYEINFPKEGIADEENWVPLWTRDQVKNALVPFGYPGFGIKKLGNDVAGGGRNFTAMIERRENVAKIRLRNQNPDTMVLAEEIISECWDPINRKNLMPRQNVGIDAIGIGKGVYDIVNRNIPGVVGINAGEKLDPKKTRDPQDIRFFNLRAKMYWKASQWVAGNGKLEMMEGENENNSVWYELTKIKYRTKLEGTQGKIQIMPKEKMLKEGTESPDVADGFAMTFVTPDIMIVDEEVEEIRREKEGTKKVDPFDPFSIGI